jgi:hypothetical protein
MRRSTIDTFRVPSRAVLWCLSLSIARCNRTLCSSSETSNDSSLTVSLALAPYDCVDRDSVAFHQVLSFDVGLHRCLPNHFLSHVRLVSFCVRFSGCMSATISKICTLTPRLWVREVLFMCSSSTPTVFKPVVEGTFSWQSKNVAFLHRYSL